MFSGLERPGQWTDNPIVKIGQYFCETSFETFWELIENGEHLVYCQHEELPFFSRPGSMFLKSKGAAAKRFKEKKIAFINPKLYCFGSQGLSDHQIYELRKAVLDRKTD